MVAVEKPIVRVINFRIKNGVVMKKKIEQGKNKPAMKAVETKKCLSKMILWSLFGLVIILTTIYIGANFINFKPSSLDESSLVLNRLQSRVEQQQNTIQTLEGDIQKLQSQNMVAASGWKPVLIENFIRMADLSLNTSSDVKSALTYLRAAKQYADDPSLSSVNHAINKDIATLEATAVVDDEEIVLRLHALEEQIAAAPMILSRTPSSTLIPDNKDNIDNHDVKSTWNIFLDNISGALRTLIVIRHQNVEPLALDSQAAVLRLNIQTKMLEAELAVVHRQDNLYHDSLQQVSVLIKQYLALNSSAKNDILQKIQKLQELNVGPNVPTISVSLNAIKEFTSTDKLAAETNQNSSTIAK